MIPRRRGNLSRGPASVRFDFDLQQMAESIGSRYIRRPATTGGPFTPWPDVLRAPYIYIPSSGPVRLLGMSPTFASVGQSTCGSSSIFTFTFQIISPVCLCVNNPGQKCRASCFSTAFPFHFNANGAIFKKYVYIYNRWEKGL